MRLLGFDFNQASSFHQWAAFILVFVMISIAALLITMAILMTLIRVLWNLKKEGKSYKQDYGKDMTSFFRFLHRDRDFEIVHIDKKGRNRMGICLEGGLDNPSTTGDPGIFIQKVKLRSPADGKLFPGDRILSVNDKEVERVPLRYALQTIREAEGFVKMYVKRAQYRQRRIKETFRQYKKDRIGLKAVFTQQQIEEIEDGFSVYDRAGTGMIKRSRVLPLLRSLGYNLHESKIWTYVNALGFTANPNIKLQDFVELMHVIVTSKHSSDDDDIKEAYNVYQDDEGESLTTSKLKQSIKRMPGRIKVKEAELQDILYMANGDKEGNIDFDDFKTLVLPTMRMY